MYAILSGMNHRVILSALVLIGLLLTCEAKSERSWWESASNVLEKGVRKGVEQIDKGVDAVGEKVEGMVDKDEAGNRPVTFGFDADDEQDEDLPRGKKNKKDKKKKVRGIEDEDYGEDYDMDRVKDDAEGTAREDLARGEMRLTVKSPEALEKALVKMRDGGVGTLYINHGGSLSSSRLVSCLRGTVRGDLLSYSYREEGNTIKLIVNWGQHIDLLKAHKSKAHAAKLTPRERQTLSQARKIVDEVVEPRMKDDVIVRAIHDYLIDHTEYDTRRRKRDAVDVLLEGKGVCQGYAHATALLLNMAGVECRCVFGFAGEAHLWNIVKIDGKWYHLDVTWDDPVGSDELRYNFFLICDQDMMAQRHRWNRKTVPATPALTPREMKLRDAHFRTAEEYVAAAEKAFRQKRAYFRGFLVGGAKEFPRLKEMLSGAGASIRMRDVFTCKRPKDVVTIIFD